MLKEKESAVGKLCKAAQDREHQLTTEIQKLTTRLEDAAVRVRQLEWNMQDMEKEKINVSERFQTF